MTTPASVSQRDVRFGPRDVTMTRDADGVIYVRPVHPLGHYPAKLTEKLDHWARVTPDRVFIGQRDAAGDWRTLTYAQFRAAARNVAQALLNRNLSSERPIAILSGNDLEHAVLGFAAYYAGIPYAPISTAYSLVSSDFGKLRDHFRSVDARAGVRERRRCVSPRAQGREAAGCGVGHQWRS